MVDSNAFPTEDLVTVQEVAKLLRVHPNSVRRWANQGLIKVYNKGTTELIKEAYAAFPKGGIAFILFPGEKVSVTALQFKVTKKADGDGD